MAPLAIRDRHPELMDDPALDAARHGASLRGLGRVNWLSGSSRILWTALAPLVRSHDGRPLRVLDVATGGGDVPIAVWHRARRRGVRLEIDGCDVSDVAIAFARDLAERSGAEVHFFARDAIQDGPADGYDVIVSSLFLHHLDTNVARDFLARTAKAASRALLIQDLVRSRAAYGFAWLGTRAVTRSEVVHIDGPLSVRGAFTVPELRTLAQEAGLTEAVVEPRWPYRQLLTWQAP
jgi:2-polyprenyl-3-methyl-5-hydroxy-6-metoxy-1,4-benzoquinol methylase